MSKITMRRKKQEGQTSQPLVVIVGETGTGKSALAMELAHRFDGEIICADSWTVRREINIGTAKPSSQDTAEIPHHLLNIVDPCSDFTAAIFKDLAIKSIQDITNRGKLPIIVGGTGLYIDSVMFDFSFLPKGDRTRRIKLNNMSNSELIELIKQRGYNLEAIDQRNKRRLIRLIETSGKRPQKDSLRSNTLILGIQLEHQVLLNKIEQRVDSMISRGLEAEVSKLANKYGWDCEAMKGIGYKQWQEYFNGTLDITEVRYKIIKDTLSLAKRQRSWFKRNKSIQWVGSLEQAAQLVQHFLNKNDAID